MRITSASSIISARCQIGQQSSCSLKNFRKTSRAWVVSMLVYVEFASAVNSLSLDGSILIPLS